MIETLCAIVEQARRDILSFYREDMQVTLKQDQSPLTLADQASHRVIVAGLRRHFPDIPVISEEGDLPDPQTRRSYTRFWLVDPLDGTKEFIKRNGDFTVNIALIEAGRVTAGVVGVPVADTLYTAERGKGALLHTPDGATRRLHARDRFDVGALSAAVSRSHPSGDLAEFLARFPGMHPVPQGSSLKFCKVAEGDIDFYPRFGPLHEWDTAAAHLVAEESGAVVTDLAGGPLVYNKEVMKHRDLLVASHRGLWDYLLAALKEARD